MILDTSAIMAILIDEPERQRFEAAIAQARALALSAATLVELTTVSGRKRGPDFWPVLDEYLRGAEVQIIPFTAEHAALAREGWRRYGKGRHPAALNLGDCFSYALAKARNEPLLFKGREFSETDVKAAI